MALSGIHPLADAHDAFAARMMLVHSASSSLDVQYYVWANDTTGILLLAALLDAAERGVQIRLLLDDNGTVGLDAELYALHQHHNIQVRLFNPFALRHSRWLGFATDFRRLNRRMHNKSLTADAQATIVGGRNIGDEYFAATEGMLFADLDILAIGAVVADVSEDFNRYWHCTAACPVDRLVADSNSEQTRLRLQARAHALSLTRSSRAYLSHVADSDFMTALHNNGLELRWAKVQMVSDSPEKVFGRARPHRLITHQLRRALGEPQQALALVSPYFVPTRAGVAAFVEMARQGIKISILTNSLAANDVAIVHAGYAKHRKALLRAGIHVYELRRHSEARIAAGKRRTKSGFSRPLGSGDASLHAKTFAVDRSKLFVGSFNFDPRSATLNTELGFVIEDAALAGQVHDIFQTQVLEQAYTLRLGAAGRINWLAREAEEQLCYNHEPDSNIWQRAGIGLLSHLPIDWLL